MEKKFQSQTLGDFRWGDTVYSNTDYDPIPDNSEHMFVPVFGDIFPHPNNYNFLTVFNYTEIQGNGSGHSQTG